MILIVRFPYSKIRSAGYNWLCAGPNICSHIRLNKSFDCFQFPESSNIGGQSSYGPVIVEFYSFDILSEPGHHSIDFGIHLIQVYTTIRTRRFGSLMPTQYFTGTLQ